MMDSKIPRIPGDPGHAETFPFPVRYGVIRNFSFEDLVIKAALKLEMEGVGFIATDCGLFPLFKLTLQIHSIFLSLVHH